MHPEDIKATLRKRHGTIVAFAQARGLKPQMVADFLRGRASAAVTAVVEGELQAAHAEAEVRSMNLDDSAGEASAHSLIAEAR